MLVALPISLLFTGFIAIWLPVIFVSYLVNAIRKKQICNEKYIILICLLIAIAYLHLFHLEYPINLYYIMVSTIFIIVILIRDFII